MEFIDLKAQYRALKPSLNKKIQNVLEHGKFIMGPEVFELEDRLSEYVGVNNTITCANGTDALTLALMALDIGNEDIVFCPTFTYFATAEVIAFAGARPIFVDSDPLTFNMCPVDLEQKVKEQYIKSKDKIKAIITVDLFGLPANYEQINKISKKYGLKIIEDAAQGFGGEINGKRAGSFGDIATTSFFPAKPLGCYGDGGAVFTNNSSYAERIKSLRVHGKGVDKYDNVQIGMNSRLDTIQAAILLEKLKAFPRELVKRNELAEKYHITYGDLFETPHIPTGYYSSWAQYTIKTDSRDKAIAYFKERGIPTVIYYNKCMHQQTAFKYLKYNEGDYPTAEQLCKTVLSLPMHGYAL